MIWVLSLLLTMFSTGVLFLPILKGGIPSQKFYMLLGVGFSAFLVVGLYGQIGRPDLSKQSALSKTFSVLSLNARMSAIAEMTDEERSARVDAMVTGLALKLEQTPDNPEGWAKLLRARTVLNQQDQLQLDILTVKKLFENEPALIDEILSAVSL